MEWEFCTGGLLWTVLLMGCGGKAVVDGTPGTGGAGGTTSTTQTTSVTTTATPWPTTTTTTTWTTTTTVTSDPCTALEAELASRLAEATACDPYIDLAQCTGEVVAYDQCGCTVVANINIPELAETAVAAYDAWVNAGCGPWLCEWCPPGPPAPWYCGPDANSDAGHCQPAYEQ